MFQKSHFVCDGLTAQPTGTVTTARTQNNKILNKDRFLNGFFRAKEILDGNLNDIRVYYLQSLHSFFFQVCKTLTICRLQLDLLNDKKREFKAVAQSQLSH